VDATAAAIPAPSAPAPPAADRAPATGTATLLALGAFAAAVAAQGGYHLPGRVLVTALAVAAGLVAARRGATVPGLRPVLVAAAVLGGWALLRSALAGDATPALPWLAGLAVLAGGLLAAGRPGDRGLLADGLTGVGVFVALTGWAGVALHARPWAAPVQGVWRAAGTLSYANAAAAVLAVTALLALARCVAAPLSLMRTSAAVVLVAGLLATASRGGGVAFAAGLVVLAVTAGPARVLRSAAPVLVGALAAVAPIVPTMPRAVAAQPLLALAGLVGGCLLALALARLPLRILLSASVVLLAGIVAAVLLVVPAGVAAGRLSLDTNGRAGATAAALDLVAEHPLAGVGPGRAFFAWPGAPGATRVAMFVHDEYLQTQVELGAAGSLLLLALLAAVAMAVLRRRGTSGTPASPNLPAGSALRAGCLAALAALIVHSGFDFLWHLPVVPLCAGLLAGMSTPEPAAPAPPHPKENPCSDSVAGSR
jgi:hypothetical protein